MAKVMAALCVTWLVAGAAIGVQGESELQLMQLSKIMEDPTAAPTPMPTATPTATLTEVPTDSPTGSPTDSPTPAPTPAPTQACLAADFSQDNLEGTQAYGVTGRKVTAGYIFSWFDDVYRKMVLTDIEGTTLKAGYTGNSSSDWNDPSKWTDVEVDFYSLSNVHSCQACLAADFSQGNLEGTQAYGVTGSKVTTGHIFSWFDDVYRKMVLTDMEGTTLKAGYTGNSSSDWNDPSKWTEVEADFYSLSNVHSCQAPQYVVASADGCPEGYSRLQSYNVCSQGLEISGVFYRWHDVATGCYNDDWPSAGCFVYTSNQHAYFSNCSSSRPDSHLGHTGVCVREEAPTAAPTPMPTATPTATPTEAPTDSPTDSPTPAPTPAPTQAPTAAPTPMPTATPTAAPTEVPTDSPTGSPTDSPTLAPTPAPTQAKAGAGGPPDVAPQPQVGGTGDPHLVNVRGQRFDLAAPGVHVLLQIPRAVHPAKTLVRVEADAQALGRACADMYFQKLNITGAWARATAGSESGLLFSVSAPPKSPNTGWITVGKVDLKVVWGSTSKGIHYLNVFVRHLTKVGYSVGGLLGEDDHMSASTPPGHCKASIALSASPQEQQQLSGSIAEAM